MPVPQPPAKIPLTLLDADATLDLPTVKSPKSVAFPVDAIVTYAISDLSPDPPPCKPLVLDAQHAGDSHETVMLPKSCELPVLAIVIYSISSLPPLP